MKRTSGRGKRSLSQKYGRAALERCWLCGLGCPAILQVAHLDQNRTNDHYSNLACLCPTCHRLYDVDLVPKKWILNGARQLRAQNSISGFKDFRKKLETILSNGKKANWKVLIGHSKSKATLAAVKAHITRKKK